MIKSRGWNICWKFFLVFISTALTFLMVEGVFRYIYLPSDGPLLSLAGRAWYAKYGGPTNRLAYRDGAPLRSESGEIKNILVVGDSFVVGQGTRDISDRFPNILEKLLGAKWDVAIAAQCGWNSKEEYRALISYPASPQWVVLSYVINDIDGPLMRAGVPIPFNVVMPKGIVAKSYFLNFFYWRFFGILEQRGIKYLAYRDAGYRNDSILQEHYKELQRIVDYVKEHNARLIVVVFPQLNNVPHSAWITKKIADFFTQQGVLTIDMAPPLAGMDSADLTANAYDPHPSELVHQMVAELLQKIIVSF